MVGILGHPEEALGNLEVSHREAGGDLVHQAGVACQEAAAEEESFQGQMLEGTEVGRGGRGHREL